MEKMGRKLSRIVKKIWKLWKKPTLNSDKILENMEEKSVE
jgi:hypothetical protein